MDEQEEKIANGKMTVQTRMQFGNKSGIANSPLVKCRALVYQFFTALTERSPDLSLLAKLGSRIYESTVETEKAFKELLQLAPTSVATLRSYLSFLLEVANNPSHAQELMAEADQIEDDISKSHSERKLNDIVFGALVDVDYSSDSLALIRVSARSENGLGIVIGGNLASLKLWGFGTNARELVGKELSSLIPEPIASVHHLLLADFLETGEQRITARSRLMFGLHKQGYIFPMRVMVDIAGEEWLTIAEEVSTNLSFVFFTGSEDNWRVTAACRSAMSLLGIDGNMVKSGSLTLADFTSKEEVLA
jgi:hypothetical protein